MSLAPKNLVFEGGGVKGIAYAGALEVLHEAKLLDGVERVAGTSAGSIVATLVSLRYSPADIKTIVNKTNFKSFEDGWWPFRIFKYYGLYKGNAFLKWMKQQIVGKGFTANATFKDLHDKGCRDLRVFSTDLNIKAVKEFSYATTPTVIVAEAVRASMSIPLFFRAWKFSNNNPDDHVYVDGGTVFNYPITTFDEDNTPNPDTLGLHLDDFQNKAPNNLDYGHLPKYVGDVFTTLLKAQVIDFEHNPNDERRTIQIDDFGISATNFKLSDAQKQQLFNSGEKCTRDFLKKNGVSVSA